MDDPWETYRLVLWIQLLYMILAAGVGFGCGYMFCKERMLLTKKPDRQSDRA